MGHSTGATINIWIWDPVIHNLRTQTWELWQALFLKGMDLVLFWSLMSPTLMLLPHYCFFSLTFLFFLSPARCHSINSGYVSCPNLELSTNMILCVCFMLDPSAISLLGQGAKEKTLLQYSVGIYFVWWNKQKT